MLKKSRKVGPDFYTPFFWQKFALLTTFSIKKYQKSVLCKVKNDMARLYIEQIFDIVFPEKVVCSANVCRNPLCDFFQYQNWVLTNLIKHIKPLN